jgi:peptide subunit release factor 1 (eRF1)
MLDADRVRSLPRIAPPVLTAYVDTNPATPRNRGEPPGYLAWLKTSARALEEHGVGGKRAAFREQVRRLERHLQSHPPRARGLVAFSGRGTWESLPLQVAVDDELHWGPPALKQLFWLLDEHRPAGVVVLSRADARFFRIWLGEITEETREAFAFDTSGWRKKHLVGPSHAAVGKRRGVQRDRFARRVDAQYGRFATELATRVRRWGDRHSLRPVLLAGPAAMVDAVVAALPTRFRPRVAIRRENLSQLSPAALHARVEPVLARWKREDELVRVDALLGAAGSGRVAVGLDQTLARLQEGRVRELMIGRGIDGTVRQCERCGWVDRSADPSCRRCGGPRRAATIRVVVPELARRHGVSVEVVAGRAATRLRRTEGMGAWLDSNRQGMRRRVA